MEVALRVAEPVGLDLGKEQRELVSGRVLEYRDVKPGAAQVLVDDID
jgi:hypothetical protein